MNQKTITNAVSTAAFSLVNILFLVRHFSYWGCASVAAILLFYVVKINVLGGKRENFGITEWLGTYLGGLAVDCIFILALEEKLFETSPYFADLQIDLVISTVFVLVIGSIILRVINKKGASISKPRFYIKNILLAVMSITVCKFYIEWEFNSIIYFVVAIVLFGVAVDAFAQHKSFTKSGFLSAYIVLLVFMLFCMLYGDFAISLVDRMMNYAAFGVAEWYYYAGAAFVFLGCAVHSHIINMSSKEACYDIRVYIWLISASLMMMVLNLFYTSYNPIFLIVYGIVNIIFLYPNHSEMKVDFFGFKVTFITLKYVPVLAMSVVLPIAFYYGWLLRAVCVLLSLIGLCAVCSKYESKKIQDGVEYIFQNSFFWYYLLVSCALFAGVTAFEKCNFAGNYVMIIFAVALAVFGSVVLLQTNRFSPKAHPIMQGVVVSAACVFMLFGVDNAGVDFNIQRDTMTVEGMEISAVSLEIDCEDDFEGECYWTMNSFVNKFNSDDDKILIPVQNGALKIFVETENGVSAECTRFFFDSGDYEKIIVGTVKEEIFDYYEPEEDDVGENLEYSENSTETSAPAPKLGNNVGDICHKRELALVNTSEITDDLVDPTASGKVSIIGFWSKEDEESLKNIEHFVKLTENLGDRISVFAIHTNADTSRLPRFIRKNLPESDITYLCDIEGEVYRKTLGTSPELPCVFVLDENGIIVAKLFGTLTYQDIENALKNALG